MKKIKKMLAFVVVLAVVMASIPNTVNAATKVKLNKKKVTLTITNSKKNPKTTLKIKGVPNKTAKKAKWSTSNKKIATVKKGKVTAKKAGKATITCKVRGKKYKCKVTVVDKRKKITDGGTLDVKIVSLGAVDMRNPDTYDRIQLYGYGVDIYNFPSSSDEDSTSPYTAENVNTYKTTRKKFFSEAAMYIINSQIIVTYNGKDVTDKASYTVQLEDDIGMVPKVDNGMLDVNAAVTIVGYKNVKLIVTYGGEKKIVPMKLTKANKDIDMCYCGELFNTMAELTKHQTDLTNEARQTGNYEHYFHVFEKHAGYWFSDCYVVDIQSQ